MKRHMVMGLALLVLTTACARQTESPKESSAPERSSQVSESSRKEKTTNQADNETLKKLGITVDVAQAVEIYHDQYPDTAIKELELERDDGRYTYEIDGLSDNEKFEVVLTATDGTVVKTKRKALDPEDQNGNKKARKAIDVTKALSLQEATAKAEAAAKGGQAYSWELERSDGQARWKVKVQAGQNRTTVKLQADTGRVLSVEPND